MTSQRPIPSGGIAKSSVSLPDGLTNEQRGLVNDIMALFRQYELDEFADPNRNTARNRLDRFTKVLHDLSFQVVQSVLNDKTVIDKITSAISQNIEITDFSSDSSSKAASDKITGKDVQERVKKTLDEKLKDGKQTLDNVRDFLRNLVEEEDESRQNLEDVEKKILDSGKEKKKPEPKEKPTVKKRTKDALGKMGITRENAEHAVAMLMAVQKKFTSGTTGKVFKSIIGIKGSQFNFKGIIEKTRASLEDSVFGKIRNMTIPGLDKIGKNTIDAVKKAIGEGSVLNKIGKGTGRVLSTIGSGGMFLLGGILGAVIAGIRIIGTLAIAGVKAIWGALKFGVGLTVQLGKLIVKSAKFILVAPFKMANALLKKKSFWATLGILLMTPQGMRALGFVVGKLIVLIKKHGILGTIFKGYLAMFKGIAMLGKWVWGKIGPTVRKFWKKSKEKIKRKWGEFLEKHPRIKAINDFLVRVHKQISGIVKIVSDWVGTKVDAVKTWWDSKVKLVEDKYDDYVKKATADGEQNIMTRDQFLANVLHQDLAAKFHQVMFHVNQAWELIQPIINFVKGMLGFLQEHSWIMTLLGILGGVMKQKTGNNPWSASIMAVMDGVLGLPGLLVGQVISYMTEKVTLWAFNMFRRKQAKLKSSSEVLKSMYGEDFNAAEAEKGTLESLGKMDASVFDAVDMVDSAGKRISGAEEKRKHLMGLFENFSKMMNEDMASADEVVNVFAHLRLTSESGKNLDFANNLQEIFSKTGILQTNLLPFDFFKVHNFFGITPEKVYKTMDEAGGAETKKDGTTTSWRTSHLNYINRLGMNLVRLKLNLLGQIYGNIVRVMDSAKEMGEENAMWLLYSYLSPGGEMYQNIRKTLLNASQTDILLKKLTESWDFDKEGEADMIKSVGTLVDMSSLQALDKATVNQTRMTERSRIVEKAEGVARQVAEIAKETNKAMDEVVNRDSKWGQRFQKGMEYSTAGLIKGAQAVAAATTLAVARGGEDNAKARILHYGGTDTGNINLGDISNVASGTALDSSINRGEAKDAERYLAETLAGKTVITDPRFAEKFYNGFFTDLGAISLDFKHTYEALNAQMEKLRGMENITESDMVKAFRDAAKNTKLSEQQLEYLAKSSYQLYQQDPDQLDKMPEFFNSIFTGLQGFVQDRESFWNSKYKGLEPHQVLQEFVKDQMKSNNFTSEQEKFMTDYFQNHYKDANAFLKSAILSKTKLNESLRQQLGKKRAEIDRIARKRMELDKEEGND